MSGETNEGGARHSGRRLAPAVAVAALLIGGAVGLAFALDWVDGAALAEGAQKARSWLTTRLEAVPLPVYILAFVVLPAFGVPVSIFYLTVAAVTGNVATGLALAVVCVAANEALSYWIAIGFAQPLIQRLVRRRGWSVPRITPANQRRVTILLRLSPVPYMAQSYLLALGGVRFGTYLLWSALIQAGLGAGMILLGGSFFAGNGRFALLGLFCLALVMTIVPLWRQRQASRREGAADA